MAPFNSAELPWVIVGYGRVGQALALLADDLDATIRATWNRSKAASQQAVVPSPATCYGPLPDALKSRLEDPCLIWLTVVDDAIAEVFDELVDSIGTGCLVVHTSGSLASTELDAPPHISTASLHPLQAISDPRAAVERFSDSFWSVEGESSAVEYLEEMLRPAHISPIRIDSEKKVLYHAAAASAANLLVSLLDAAIAIAEGADIEADTAREMLTELAESSLENLASNRPAKALTGPAARGDLEVIERHRQALASCDDGSLLEIYDILTRRALDGLAD